jgi:hypothetical protein
MSEKRKQIFTERFVEWLTLLLRIREVTGSNLSPDAGYTDSFCGFP